MSSMHVVIEKFRRTLRHWDLLQPHASVLIAVSGGVDSMVLLHLFQGLAGPRGLSLRVVHFNHRLRGQASAADEALVRRYCRKYAIPLTVARARPWKSRANLQERAREQRYRFFQREAARRGIDSLALAHHADDQAESFLMRWIQGAGLKGLSGIPLQRREGSLSLIRPLLLVARREIQDYQKKFSVPYREDASNRSDKYLRNRLRFLLRGLNKEQPQLALRAATNALFLQADEALLATLTQEAAGRLIAQGGRVSDYRLLPRALRLRVLQRLVGVPFGQTLPADQVLKLEELLQGEEGRVEYHLSGGLRFRRQGGSFLFDFSRRYARVKGK